MAVGDRVRVEQQITGRAGVWKTKAEGLVESFGPEPTGSWFAHGKHDRLWLQRLRLRKDDGEITTIAIDPSTDIEVLK
jgi:hypothetical protein